MYEGSWKPVPTVIGDCLPPVTPECLQYDKQHNHTVIYIHIT